jgi:hypothetical protein
MALAQDRVSNGRDVSSSDPSGSLGIVLLPFRFFPSSIFFLCL